MLFVTICSGIVTPTTSGITGYETVEDVMFTVFRMIVVDDYNYKGILGDHVSSKTNVTYVTPISCTYERQ